MSHLQNKRIEKLRKQVARYEAKGYVNTAAHQLLARELKLVEAVKPRNTKKVIQEEPNGKQDL